MLGAKERAAATAPKEKLLSKSYRPSKHLSYISYPMIQEFLGWILIALNWSTTTNNDRVALLQYVDGLERKLIDLRNGEAR
jgi:hypothetical protein